MVRFPSKSTYLEFFFGFSQPDGYNCGCGQGYTCQRYGSNNYWGKCVASCSSDSSCKKTECCSGRRCKPRKGAGEYCPLKGVIKLFFLNQSFIFIFQRYEFTFTVLFSQRFCYVALFLDSTLGLIQFFLQSLTLKSYVENLDQVTLKGRTDMYTCQPPCIR